MRLPDPSRAQRIRAAIHRARRAHEYLLANVQPPEYPRGWARETEFAWVIYDRGIRTHAQTLAPFRQPENVTYWRTLAHLFAGEVLDKEWRMFVEPPRTRHGLNQVRRELREVRRGR